MAEIPTLHIPEESKAWATIEDINKSQSSFELSKKLTQINNILKVLDLPDNQEDIFKKMLEQQSYETLKNLDWQWKDKILTFLFIAKKNELSKVNKNENIKQKIEKNLQKKEQIYQTIETQRINIQIQKIKATFTPSILNNNKDIADQLTLLDTLHDPTEKEKIFREILNILKNPWRLKTIIEELGWADKNNSKYQEFKNSLISLDPSFEKYFAELENLNSWTNLDTNSIITSIEKDSWWIVDIDLNSNIPVNKMSLIWSSYSFDEKIDKQALEEFTIDSTNKLAEVQRAVSSLKGAYAPFDSFINRQF